MRSRVIYFLLDCCVDVGRLQGFEPANSGKMCVKMNVCAACDLTFRLEKPMRKILP